MRSRSLEPGGAYTSRPLGRAHLHEPELGEVARDGRLDDVEALSLSAEATSACVESARSRTRREDGALSAPAVRMRLHIMRCFAHSCSERSKPAETSGNGCYAARAVERVLVLNASYEPLNVCSLRRAHVLVWKGKAEILENVEKPLRSADDDASSGPT